MSQKSDSSRIPLRLLVAMAVVFAVYLGAFLAVSETGFRGDEGRYAIQAMNLTEGYFISPERRWIDNGPGYPLLIAPIVMLGLDWWFAKLLNPFLMMGAFGFLYMTVRLYLPARAAALGVLIAACYYPFVRDMYQLLSEPLTCLLITAWCYTFCRLWHDRSLIWIVAGGLLFGYLCLTKVIFGYLLVLSLLGAGLTWAISRDSRLSRTFVSLLVATVVCLPYLIYTQQFTGKSFHWADMGAYNLYWMSSPFPNDSGDWHRGSDVFARDVLANHRPFFEEYSRTEFHERSQLLTATAIDNIRSNPLKYMKNWVSNVGRLVFNYPFDYQYQSVNTYFYIVPNTILMFVIGYAVWFMVRGRFVPPTELLIIAAAGIVILGGTSLIHANSRMARPILFLLLPALIVVLAESRRKRTRTDSQTPAP